MAKILIVEDNETLREGMTQVLAKAGHEVRSAPNGRLGLEAWSAERPDVTLTDLKMDEMGGMEVLGQILERDADAVVMIVTAFGSIERAVEAMRVGAFDFIPKPFPPDLLRTKVAKALDAARARAERERLVQHNEMLEADRRADLGDPDMIGKSAAMRRVSDLIGRVAPTDSTVHISGESGTGKELAARAIHERSHRADGPFIKVNSSALPEALLESELFGHEKGAFTSAHKRRLGRFELADGGTIFLDEIGDISAPIQLKLLRVLQEREIERVGGEETVRVDVRVVTATNKDLKEEVEQGRFREDLFYRLHIIPIELPPLRDRASDIAPLAEHFISKLAQRTRSEVRGLAPAALAALSSYRWPGNVRELENVIERAMVFAHSDQIALEDLPPAITGVRPGAQLPTPDGERTLPEILETIERELILAAYTKAQGTKTETARLLGIKPSALYYKLDKYGIDEGALEEA